jgi:dihydrofolate reductase
MGKVRVINHLSLDGVMQAPGRADEDRRGGFQHGGWAVANGDAVMAQKMGEGSPSNAGVLLGRRTYEDFARVWPNRPNDPYSRALDEARKYVASRTLREPLPWRNSILLAGDACDAVAELRQGDEGLNVFGSGELVRSLIDRDLIDEYLLLIHPLILGSGRRLFDDRGPFSALALVGSVTTTTGVVIATYRPAADRDFAP